MIEEEVGAYREIVVCAIAASHHFYGLSLLFLIFQKRIWCMATLTPNRQALKDLADFNIDAQFCQQYGTQVLNYSGEVTHSWQQARLQLESVIDDLLGTLEQLKEAIPNPESD